MCLLLGACTQLISTQETEPPSGSTDVSPGAVVPDPEGTIELKMRNWDNGRTYLGDFLFITSANNFKGGKIAALGSVRGLGNVARIPSSGWADEVAVTPGNGYVVYGNNKFYRIYVEEFTLAAETEGIIGAAIKYQTPFYGLDEAPQLEKNEVTGASTGFEEKIKFENTSIIPVEITSSEPWCRGSLDLFNAAITVYCNPSDVMEERTATLTLVTSTDKKAEITVKQEAVPISGSFESINSYTWNGGFPCTSIENCGTYRINSNALIPNLSVTSDKNWCKVFVEDGIVYVSLEANYSGETRNAKISLMSGSDIIATTTLAQNAATISLSNNTFNQGASSGYIQFYLYFTPFIPSEINVEYDDSIISSISEITGNGNQIKINYKANISDQPRSTRIKFTGGTSGPSAILVLNQEAAYVNVPKSTVLFDKNQSNRTYTISSNADWTAQSSASWCTLSRNGNALTIRVESTTVDRKATITFPGFSASITVDQSKYATGDEYSEGNVIGTVLYTDDNIRLIYKEVGGAQWSTENVQIGANSHSDGMANMNVVKAIPGWQSLYPAFALCDALNTNGVEGWYLPSYSEGNVSLPKIKTNAYWSSTERQSDVAYTMDGSYYSGGYFYKSQIKKVVAVRKF